MHPAPSSEHEAAYENEPAAAWHEPPRQAHEWDMERLLVWGLVLVGVAALLLAAVV